MIEQRRAKRFELQLPLEVVRAGSDRTLRICKTKNVSSGGVLFQTDSQMEIGGPIEYMLTLINTPSATVHLRCMGKVVRLEKTTHDAVRQPYSVAATLERYEFLRSIGIGA